MTPDFRGVPPWFAASSKWAIACWLWENKSLISFRKKWTAQVLRRSEKYVQFTSAIRLAPISAFALNFASNSGSEAAGSTASKSTSIKPSMAWRKRFPLQILMDCTIPSPGHKKHTEISQLGTISKFFMQNIFYSPVIFPNLILGNQIIGKNYYY